MAMLDVQDPYAAPARGLKLDVADPFATPAPPPAPPAAPAAKPSGNIRRTIGDLGTRFAMGTQDALQSIVGLADIPTGGYAGKAANAIGFKPGEAKEVMADWLSPEAKAAQQKVDDAKGFVPTVQAYLANPSTIVGGVAESLPSMLAGGAVARGLGLVPQLAKLGAPALGFAGEGAIGAGTNAEQSRVQNKDGLLTPRQTVASVGSGLGTAAFASLGGRVARKLGIEDLDVALAGGSTAKGAGDTVANSGKAAIARKLAAGALSEGVLEELPQSMQEQAWQNYGNGRPLGEGVVEAGAQGLLLGSAMGAPAALLHGSHADHIPGQPKDTTNPAAPLALPAPGPITVDAGGNAVTPEQEYQRQQGQFRRGYNGSQPIVDADFTDVTPQAEQAPGDVPALPAPGGLDQTIDVAPDGTAFTPGQMALQQEADAGTAQTRANAGLTPDVNRARAHHPAAVPNTLPDGSPLPDPGNGSISRAVNLAAGNGALQQAADQQTAAQAADAAAVAAKAQPNPADRNGMEPAYRDQLKGLIHDAADLDGDIPDVKTLRSTYDLNQRDAAELRREVAIERNTVAPPPGVPAQITKGMRKDLIGRGYSADQVAALRPQQAWDILNAAPANDAPPTAIQGSTNVANTEGSDAERPAAGISMDDGRDAGSPGVVAGDPTGQAPGGGIATSAAPTADAQVRPVTAEYPGGQGAEAEADRAVAEDRASEPEADPAVGSSIQEATSQQTAELSERTDRPSIDGTQSWPEIPEERSQRPSAQATDNMTPPQGGVSASGVARTIAAQSRKPATKIDRAGKPMDLLRVIAANGGLDREDFRRHGVDPAELGRRAGFHYVFRKRGKDGAARGMTLSDLREFMQQEGYLQADHPDRPAEVDDNDALDVFDRAFRGGEEVYAPDQMEAVGAHRERQEAENDAYRAEQAAAQGGAENASDPFDEWLSTAPRTSDDFASDNLLERALQLGATDAEIYSVLSDGDPGLQRLIDQLENDDGDLTRTAEGVGRPPDSALSQAGERSGSGPGELPPEPSRPASGNDKQEVREEVTAKPAQSGLFAAPTARESVEGEARRRDAARDGRAGTGRTDMAAGDGELFAGRRPDQTDVEAAAAAAATHPDNDRPEPSQAQKEAGNYAKGHLRIDGLDISIENPAGSRRRPEWPPLKHAYGYIKGTIGNDKDHVDVFLSDRATDTSLPVFVVDQNHANGHFDEHKAMLGFEDEAAARAGYLANYSKGWNGLGGIKQMTHAEFKEWVRDRDQTNQRASETPLFSRSDRSAFNANSQLREGSQSKPQTRAQVTAAITGITSKWKGDRPRVVVLENADGLPDHVKSDPGHRTAEGFYDPASRTAYLVAPNIRGGYDLTLKRQVSARERAQRVLAHEVIGHYAVEDITGPELWNQLGDSVQRMRDAGTQKELFAEVDRRNRGASKDVLLKETLAVMAEKGVRTGVMDRVVAAVRRFLRGLGFDLPFSDAEVRQHIARAARHVEVAADEAAPAGAQTGEVFRSRPDLDPNKRVSIVNMVGGAFGDPARDLKAVRGRARDYLRKIRASSRLMTNDDTGWKIGLSGAGIRELTNFDPAKLNMLLALPRITKVAILANTRRAEKDSLVKAFHTLYAPVRVNQDLRIARLVVREDVNGNFAYDFQQSDVLEKVNPASAGIPAIESGARQNTGFDGPNLTALDPLVGGGATRQAGASMTLAQLRDAVNAVDRPGWQWSQPGDQFRTDARGNPFVQRGEDRFVQRGDQWYLSDAAGRPADFLTPGAAQTAAQRTGGQVHADPNEGARRTWSVVLPDGAGISRAASENLFSQPDTEREGQGLRDKVNTRAQRIFDGVDKVMPGRREFPERMDEQQRAAAKKFATFAPKEKLADRYDRIKSKAADKLVQRVFDQFRSLRGLSQTAFMQAHMSKGTDGALEAAFKYGAPVLRDGAYAVDTRDGGIQAVLSKLQGEHETMLMWMVGNRAERLLAEGREQLFNKDDIAALKRLADGKMPDGTDRATAYRAAMKEINRYNRAFLDIAEKAGVVNAESRKVWEDEFYIPFYREMEQGSNAGPGQVGLLRQRVIERLAGGSDTLGDPLENMLANWSHMLTASMRNMAANNALDQGVLAGIATSLEKPDKDSVWTMRDGKEAYWHVNDPMVLEALESLNFNGYDNPLMRQAGKFKRALTIGVTASPSFRVRNMLRDSLGALGTAEVGYNPLRNMVDGWKATGRDTDTQLNLLAGGGTVRFGSFNDGDQAAHAKRLISMGVGENQILDTKDKVRNAFRRLADQWQEIGDRAETINRAVIYQRAIAAGKSHLEASFEARDLMNFTSMGSSAAIRALAQVLPFFNARLQGADRLVRGAKANPRRFAAVAGTVAMASALLYLLNADDDDYKALPDYVRDTYWPIKLGGKWLYLPKPFEIGAMGTVIERMTELAVAGDDYQAKDFRNTLVSVLSGQLAMNPIPQIVRPVTEAAFNYDLFRMAPIDTMGQQNLLPQDRYTARTAAPAVVAGKLTGISPQRLEHMVEGYFGWLGIQALNAGDWAMRGALGLPSNPNRDLTKTNNLFVLGDFVKENGTASNKYLTRFYDVQGDIDQIYASASQARKTGDGERAQQLLQDPKLRLRPAYQAADKQITKINQQIRSVSNSRELSAQEKSDRLLRLNAMRAEAARRIDRIARRDQ